MNSLDYWKECISIAADECGANLTAEQIEGIAESVQGGHENYGMAFYSPPATDRYSQIEKEWQARLDAKQAELDGYRNNAETAIKKALRQGSDALVTIGKYGKVLRHDGRTEVIQ